MKLILLSGGSGKRLWPLSNEVRSKQFLKLLHNSSGKPLSMVQKVWRQLASCGWSEKVYISTNSSHVDLIHSQIGTEVPLIIEPHKKDTFPAIALAATYLHSREGVDKSEVVTVIPVDSCVEELFWVKVRELEEALGKSGADIALLGVTPTYASTKYGYIVPLDTQTEEKQTFSYKRVGSFKEKPTPEVAQELVARQALWNCGVFSFQLGYILRELEKKGLPTVYDQLLAI